MQLIFLLEQVLNGLLVGAYYLLIALGLSLIFSLGGIVNLAHGAFYAIGAYLAVAARRRASASPARSSPRRCWSALLGIADRALLVPPLLPLRSDPRRCCSPSASRWSLEQALRMIFGAAPLPFSIPPELRGQLFVGDFIYPRYRLMMLGVAVAAVAATWFLLLPHAVRPRGARRRAEPRHGRRARHLARSPT